MRLDDNTARVSMLMPADVDYHLEMASAARGMSKSEYIRMAVRIALTAEPVVTSEYVANLIKLSAMAAQSQSALVDA